MKADAPSSITTDIDYIQDKNTNLCFAVVIYYKGSRGGMGMSHVPCVMTGNGEFVERETKAKRLMYNNYSHLMETSGYYDGPRNSDPSWLKRDAGL